MPAKVNYTVFDKAWFERHQLKLLKLANSPLVGRSFRRLIGVDEDIDLPVVLLTPNSRHYYVGETESGPLLRARISADDWRLSTHIAYNFAPLWKTLHNWDMVVANPLIPALNAGFDTFSDSPDPSPESTSVDGMTIRSGVNESYAAIQGGAGGSASDSGTDANAQLVSSTTTNQYSAMRKCALLVDTSSLGAGAIVSAGNWDIHVLAKTAQMTANFFICGSAPASNTAIVASDHASIDTTQHSDLIGIASITAPATNTWTLDASGLLQVAPAGVSKFGFNFTEPSWLSDKTMDVQIATAESANDPVLELTYTKAVGGARRPFAYLLGAAGLFVPAGQLLTPRLLVPAC